MVIICRRLQAFTIICKHEHSKDKMSVQLCYSNVTLTSVFYTGGAIMHSGVRIVNRRVSVCIRSCLQAEVTDSMIEFNMTSQSLLILC